nr:MAG TPA: CI repressor [Caudoviricetes sp.]
MVVLKTLNSERQSKVYDFAMKQLKEQNDTVVY